MSEKVFENAFERGIERYAEMLFCEGAEKAIAACLREHPDPTEVYMRLLDLDTRAKRARVWHAKHTPCWCQPLPISYDEQESILCSSYMLRHMLVYYTGSLRQLGYNFLKHPSFLSFACGVMADPNGPEHLLADAECLAGYPPRPLAGLKGTLWSPPEPLSAGLPPEHLSKGRIGKARSREELINS